MANLIKYYLQKFVGQLFDKPIILEGKISGYSFVKSQIHNLKISENSTYYPPFYFNNVSIDSFTYIGRNSYITNTNIAKFCSIGPNFCSSPGIHPINGISTSPIFYSNNPPVGRHISSKNNFVESKKVTIGNDVYIGANVTILDGITIGDGAIIGAGAVVTKNVEPYAIVGGVPAKLIKYRFEKEIINKLLKVQWWDFDEDKLLLVDDYFFDIEKFLEICMNLKSKY
jgi:acetyltransferase-like isoleucine patch superfamily enzyme